LLEGLNVRLEYADQLAYESHIAETRAQLDEATWNTAWHEGQKTPLEHIIAETLGLFKHP
jgi:hypothetical protein